jgi:hypothetical protein
MPRRALLPGRRRLLAAAIIAGANIASASIARAHAPVATRSLRLQLRGGRLEGLLSFHLPAAAARVYAAAPDPALALVPQALAGLRLESAGRDAALKVIEAHAHAAADGALDATLLLDAGAVDSPLRLSVEAGPPLPIDLLAETDVRVHLDEGPGAAIRGGLSLRPRPGLACVVSFSGRAARKTPR